MKKLVVLLLAVLLLLCGCEKKIEYGGYTSDNGLLYIDFEDPVIEADKKEVKVTLSDGREDTSYLKRPILNVDLEGAHTVTKSIKTYLDDKYADYFKNPDDRIVKVDYSTDDVNDILTVLITEEITTPEGTTELTTSFYYEALGDTELNIVEYSNMNGAQMSTVFEALYETDWAIAYEEETGTLPYEDVMTALVCKGDLLFEAYCTNADGKTQTVIEMQVEDVPLTLPNMEDYNA